MFNNIGMCLRTNSLNDKTKTNKLVTCSIPYFNLHLFYVPHELINNQYIYRQSPVKIPDIKT